MPHRRSRSTTPHSGEGRSIPHEGEASPSRPVPAAIKIDKLLKLAPDIYRPGIIFPGDDKAAWKKFETAATRVIGEEKFQQEFGIGIHALVADREQRDAFFHDREKTHKLNTLVGIVIRDKRAQIRSADEHLTL